MTLIVNLFGGPGAGKSTTCAGVFYELKRREINCEMAREWVKEMAWRGHLPRLEDQLYIFAKQLRRQQDLIGKVDVVITDSPILQSCVYGWNLSTLFNLLVQETHDSFNNFNIFIKREKAYNPAGRFQDAEEAENYDERILKMLEDQGRDYNVFHQEIPMSILVDIIQERARLAR